MRQILIKQYNNKMEAEKTTSKNLISQIQSKHLKCLRQQIEFYLSPVNLSLIAKDKLKKGWISIRKFLKLAKIKNIFRKHDHLEQTLSQRIAVIEKALQDSRIVKSFQHKLRARRFKYVRGAKKTLYIEADHLTQGILENALSNKGFSKESYQLKLGASWIFVHFQKCPINRIEAVKTQLQKQLSTCEGLRVMKLEDFNLYKNKFNSFYQELCTSLKEQQLIKSQNK